jgi:hypothetical protein
MELSATSDDRTGYYGHWLNRLHMALRLGVHITSPEAPLGACYLSAVKEEQRVPILTCRIGVDGNAKVGHSWSQ